MVTRGQHASVLPWVLLGVLLGACVLGTGAWVAHRAFLVVWTVGSAAVAGLVQLAAAVAQPAGTVHDFFVKLRAGDAAAAYELTTADFRKRRTLMEFRDFVAAHAELTAGLRGWLDAAAGKQPDELTFAVKAGDARESRVQLRLRLEGKDWRVDDVIVP